MEWNELNKWSSRSSLMRPSYNVVSAYNT